MQTESDADSLFFEKCAYICTEGRKARENENNDQHIKTKRNEKVPLHRMRVGI